MKNKFLAGLTACAMLATSAMTGTLSAVAATGMGGYEWTATSGYQTATTSVTSNASSVDVSFENAGVGVTNQAAGFCAVTNAEDWSTYSTMSFTVENTGSETLYFAVALGTGSDWSWHQSSSAAIAAGESKELTYYLAAEEWTLGEDTTAVNDLYMVQRINMMVMSADDDSTVTGSLTVSDFALGGASGSIEVEPKDGFYVSGSTLYDANQNPFVMRGVNYSYTWFKWEGNEAAVLEELAGYGANAVRIVLSNGAQYTKDTVGAVSNLVSLCEANDLVAVFEVHDATGKDDEASLLACAEYFAEIKSALVGHEDTVIINIANEWQGTTNASSWQSAYINAVEIIRDAGLTHCIMCDAGGWGQGAEVIPQSGAAILESDPENNVMFSIHMYGTAGGTAAKIKSNIDAVLVRNLCLCIGEFGYTHSDGDVDEAYLMQYCDEVDVGWLAWSWYGNGSPVEYLDLSSANVGGTLSADWGETVVNGTYGMLATSEICSVYSGAVTTTTTEETTTTTEETTTTTTEETTTTTAEETTTTSETVDTSTWRACEICGTLIPEEDGAISPLGLFICPDCVAAGAGGTRPVTQSTDSTTETTTTTTTTGTATVTKYGDINCDGDISVSDIILLARYLGEDTTVEITETGILNGDCNGDDFTNTSDLSMISGVLVHLLTEEDLIPAA